MEREARRSFGWRYAAVLCVVLAEVAVGQQAPSGLQQGPVSTQAVQRADATIALSTAEMLRLIGDRPEIAVELKRLLAGRLRQQGLAVDEDGITDQALFRRIAEDGAFRQAATLLLRARGYIGDAEIERAAAAASRREGPDGPLREFAEGQSAPADGTGGLAAVAPGDRAPADSFDDLISGVDPMGLPSEDSLSHRPQEIWRQPGAAETDGADVNRLMQRDQMAGSPRTARDAAARPEIAESTAEQSAEQQVLRQPAPYNLLAMRDLYTQVAPAPQKLRRFGAEVFLTRTRDVNLGVRSSAADTELQQDAGRGVQSAAMDQPPGPDYVLGRGDALTITLWGGVSETLTRRVDSSGQVVLPEAGPMSVAGLKLEQAQELMQERLTPQFRGVHVTVAIARVRSVRIYVVGDVQRPGAYDIPAQSTPLNALYAAGGPTATGSLRRLRHMRGGELVREVDLYDFLLRGVRSSNEPLQDGDTVLVPAVGAQVAVTGDVKRAAIYELIGGPSQRGTTLSDLLDEAGGLKASAAVEHIRIDRIAADEQRVTISVGDSSMDLAALRKAMESFTVQDGDRVTVEPIAPWSERAVYLEGHVVRPGRQAYHAGMVLTDVVRSYRDLLPEPAERGQIIRLTPPDLHPKTIEFDVQEALAGGEPIHLQPFDTIRIPGRYDADAPKVTVRGEVMKPGVYALAQGMTASELVKIAGGLTRSALRSSADLASYGVENGQEAVSKRTTIALGEALQNDGGSSDPVLKPGDVLTVHQIAGWNDIGASVQVSGEVMFPGSYGIEQGERLSSVLRRAGGLRGTAYPEGAVLLRQQVKDLEEKSRLDLIHQIESAPAAAKLGTNLSGQDQAATLQLLQQQQREVLQQLRSQPPSGRLVIKINKDFSKWENTDADLEMRSGDVLVMPKRPGFVLVSGQVYNSSALTYVPNKSAGWYLRRAGGATDLANEKEIFIVRANGSIIGRRSGSWYSGNVLSTRLDAGDVIVVPQKIVGGSMFWKNTLTAAQVLSAAALPLAIAGF